MEGQSTALRVLKCEWWLEIINNNQDVFKRMHSTRHYYQVTIKSRVVNARNLFVCGLFNLFIACSIFNGKQAE